MPSATASLMLMMFAPSTAGMDMRKENRTANFRLKPRVIPAAMVVPDRDRPGTTATACAQPTRSASSIVDDRAVLRPWAMRSEKKRMQPVASRAKPMKRVLPYRPSTLSLMGRITKSGRVARTIMTIIRPSGESRWTCARRLAENRQATSETNSRSSATMSFQ